VRRSASPPPALVPVALALSLSLGLAGDRPAVAAEAEPLVPRPPILFSSPRTFGRNARPVEPRTSLALEGGYLLGRVVNGVEEQGASVGILAEAALGPAGVFLEAPLVFDRASTEGIYGPGSGSVRGAGDLLFGVDALVGRPAYRGIPLRIGLSASASVPTAGERTIVPETPLVPSPPHHLPAKRWTLSVGGAVALATRFGLSAQANLDLLLHLHDRPLESSPEARSTAVFASPSLTLAYRHPRLPLVIPLLELDLDLELVGLSSLRQLVFLHPGLRICPHPRVAIDLGARIALHDETAREQRAQLGVLVGIALGPEGDGAWSLPFSRGAR
jgi:hypothetical protein